MNSDGVMMMERKQPKHRDMELNTREIIHLISKGFNCGQFPNQSYILENINGK